MPLWGIYQNERVEKTKICIRTFTAIPVVENLREIKTLIRN